MLAAVRREQVRHRIRSDGDFLSQHGPDEPADRLPGGFLGQKTGYAFAGAPFAEKRSLGCRSRAVDALEDEEISDDFGVFMVLVQVSFPSLLWYILHGNRR